MVFNTTAPIVGNLSFVDLNRLKPLGWTLIDPPVNPPYNFEIIDPFYWYDVTVKYKNLAFYVGGVYLLTIFGLQKWMKNRQPFHLKTPLVLWNMTFSFFSFVTFVRTWPGLWYIVQQPNGFYASICLRNHMDIPTGFWFYMFVLSKFVELGDHVFTVLRKRPLSFLQWYHHAATMIITWFLCSLVEPIHKWYVIPNVFSHTFVYSYLALKSYGVKIPGFVGKLITSIQLIEMFIGLFVNLATVYLLYLGYECSRFQISINSFTFLYFSFIILFGKLFYESIGQNKKKKAI